MRRFKNQPPGPTCKLQFVFTVETRERLLQEAINQSVRNGDILTLSDVVRDAIESYLEGKRVEQEA